MPTADRDVHILDPFTGTGNYIVNIMRRIPKTALPHKFASELHCNEIMLLPYYVASMNIEHAYYEATGKYEPFEGICLVDTFQTAEKEQAELSFFNEKNSVRVNRQKKAPIRIIIGNPPYNAWQADENDDNKNRKYEELDRRVRITYAGSSSATLKNSLSDPYIKAIRWASDQLGESGIVCFVPTTATWMASRRMGCANTSRTNSTLFTSWTSAATCGRTRNSPARRTMSSASRSA